MKCTSLILDCCKCHEWSAYHDNDVDYHWKSFRLFLLNHGKDKKPKWWNHLLKPPVSFWELKTFPFVAWATSRSKLLSSLGHLEFWPVSCWNGNRKISHSTTRGKWTWKKMLIFHHLSWDPLLEPDNQAGETMMLLDPWRYLNCWITLLMR